MPRRRRQRISQALNRLIAGGQGFRCGKCSETLRSTYEINHIVSHAAGGDSTPFNLVALCTPCHAWFTQNQARWRAQARHVEKEGGPSTWFCEGCHQVLSRFFRGGHERACTRTFTHQQFPTRAPPSQFLDGYMSREQAAVEAARAASNSARNGSRKEEEAEEGAPSAAAAVDIPMLRYSWPAQLRASLRATMVWDKAQHASQVERLCRYFSKANLCPPYFVLAMFDNDAEVRAFVHQSFATLAKHVPKLHPPPVGTTWQCRSSSAAAGMMYVPVVGDLKQPYEDEALRRCSSLSGCFTGDLRWEAVASTTTKGLSPAAFWRAHSDRVLRARLAFQATAAASPCQLSLRGLFKEVRFTVAECTTFRPAVAKFMALPWGRGDRVESVLDPCGGWGDRLLGFGAAPNVRRVVVNDPNTPLLKRYGAIARVMLPHLTVQVVGEAFERIPMAWEAGGRGHPANPETPFDRIATCPPFFTRELYSADEAQSTSRFPRLAEWLQGFLIPLHVRALARLRVGGYMMVAIADYAPLHSMEGASFTADMVRGVLKATQGTVVLVGVVRYSLVGRGEHGEEVCRHQPQPIFVWRKRSTTPLELLHV